MRDRRVMYQSNLRRDLEKRLRRDRNMLILPFGVIATIGLVLSVTVLLKHVDHSDASSLRSGGLCNHTAVDANLNVCELSFEHQYIRLSSNISLRLNQRTKLICCIKNAWHSCVNEALLSSKCGQDTEVKQVVDKMSEHIGSLMKHKVCYHYTETFCESEEEDPSGTKRAFLGLGWLLWFGRHDDSKKSEVRKPKQWNGLDWNDKMLTDNDTSESEFEEDSSEFNPPDVTHEVFKGVLNISNNEDDGLDETTTSIPTTSMRSTTVATTTTTLSAIPALQPELNVTVVDEIEVLVKEEEENFQEDDTIFNETIQDTSDLRTKKVRTGKFFINSSGANTANLIVIYINLFILILNC